MTLEKKIVTLFLMLGLTFCVAGYIALQVSLVPIFMEFERKSAHAAQDRVNGVIDADSRGLAVLNMEYAYWDDTYEFANGDRPGYPADELSQGYNNSIGINLMLMFDAQGNALYSQISDPASGRRLRADEELPQSLGPGHPLLAHDSIKSSVAGFMETRTGVMQVMSYPILKSTAEGPIAGSVIVGRFLTPEIIARQGARATAQLSLHRISTDDMPSPVTAVLQGLQGSTNSTQLQFDESNSIYYQILYDLLGAPIAVLETITPRRVAPIADRTIRTAMMFLAIASAVFLIASLLFLQHLIVTPIETLTQRILNIRLTGDLHFETDSSRSDEVGVLTREFGRMTEKLAGVQDELGVARDDAISQASAKTEFLARMSHEIRTPMNGVLGMTELLRETDLDGRQQRFVGTIYESAESLLEIINDILDFSKINAGKLHLELIDVDLRDLLEETVGSLAGQAHQKGLALVSVVPPELNAAVKADPGRLRQVLTNLLGNAIKFTDMGEVVASVSATKADDEHLDVRFAVTDSGIGIRRAKQNLIFDAFTQEDGTTTRLYGGTGLGLAISGKIVDSMGGNLEVESTHGRGSTFSFVVRLETSGETFAATCDQLQCIAGKRVLIVDDNATNREIFERQLGSWRADTRSASSAQQALEILENGAASGDVYDLAILDMHMPHASGLELARSIRRNQALAGLKLLCCSSLEASIPDDTVRDLGIGGQLTKPIRQSHLYDSLLAVMSGKAIGSNRTSQSPASKPMLAGRVLLAEDNVVNQTVAIAMLEDLGLDVEVAADGREAVEKATAQLFDAILMDCQMPIMDGFQASDAIRRFEAEKGNSRIPIIAVTANALKGDDEKCLAAGMDEYLTKPFTREQLHSVIVSLIPVSGISETTGSEGRNDNVRKIV